MKNIAHPNIVLWPSRTMIVGINITHTIKEAYLFKKTFKQKYMQKKKYKNVKKYSTTTNDV